MVDPQPTLRLAAAVGLIVLGLTLLTIRGVLGGGQDEEIVFLQTASLAHDGDLAFSPAELAEVAAHSTNWRDAVAPARDGRWYAVYGPAQPFAALPLYALGRLAAGGDRGPARATVVRWVCGLNPLLTALGAALLAGWLLGLGFDRRVALAGGLGWALATTAWPYTKTFLSEPLTALAYLATAFAVWRAGRDEGRGGTFWAQAGGAALAFAGLARPHNLVLAPLFLGFVLASPRERLGRGFGFLLPVVAVAAWWLAFNWYRFGQPLAFGYEAGIQGDFAVGNLPRGLVGQLLSPGRGLVWYAPPVLLGLWGYRVLRERDARLAAMLLTLAAAQLLFYSLRSTWWGNWCWGPRYLVPVLPLLAMLAAPALVLPRLRPWAAALAGLGVLGALAGLVVYNGLYQDVVYRQPGGLDRLLWDPRWSPLVGHWRYAFKGYVDLLLWHVARVDPAFALAAGLLRAAPALAGLWLLRREAGR